MIMIGNNYDSGAEITRDFDILYQYAHTWSKFWVSLFIERKPVKE